MHFESLKVEEMLSVIMIETDDHSDYQAFFTTKPAMKPSYLEKLQKQSGMEESNEMEVEL